MYTEKPNNIEFKEHINLVAKEARTHINRIIGLATMLSDKDDNEVTHELLLSSYRLLTQNMNMMYIHMEELISDTAIINAEAILTGIIGECTTVIETAIKDALEHEMEIDTEYLPESVGCKLQFVVKNKKSSVKIDEKAFTLAVMNLLQNALMYSPPNTTVIVKLDTIFMSDDERYVCVSVKNLNGLKKCDPGLGLTLCKRIAERCGGMFECIHERGCITAKIMLPLQNEEPGVGLSSEFVEYFSDRYKPVKLFMYEVVERIKRNVKLED
ncbi:MAG: hypothetical protein FWH07_03925 [Oscillospiraceae bacterium]|nr:hypothetical protein [Oscillospiraceae bacterium]